MAGELAPPAARAADGPSATARRVLGLADRPERSPARLAAERALERVGGPLGLVVAAAPTVAFVVVDAAAGLSIASGAVVVVAGLGCALRVLRRESLAAAIAGFVVAGVCAATAALVGEARAFFLPTMVLPVIFVVVYVVSLLARRPLMGLMINPLSGGPRRWSGHEALRRVYTISSLLGLALSIMNLLTRVIFYVGDQPGILAVVQVTATSLFALHFAVTLVVARRVAGRSTAASTPLVATL